MGVGLLAYWCSAGNTGLVEGQALALCVACAHTLVGTDEFLPQDHNPDDDALDTGHVADRTCVPADD